jgi:hypothetical protein
VVDLLLWPGGWTVKESTRNIAKMHGWRVDRTAHNWLYFVYYGLYVRVFLWAGHLVYKVLGRISLGSEGRDS